MALPSSGPITMAQVAAEIGISASGLSLDDSRVRQLAGRPSGSISMSDLLGKAWLLPPTIAVGSWSGSFYNGEYRTYSSDTLTLSLGGGAGTVTYTTLSGNSNTGFTQKSQTSYEFFSRTAAGGTRDVRFTVTNASGSASITVRFRAMRQQ